MSLTYTTYVNQIANLMVILSTDSNFQTMLPGMIDYAEQRMYRELDLQVTRVSDTTASFTANNRSFTLPTSVGTFVVVEQVNAYTPSTATSTSGTKSPLIPVTKEFLDATWGSNSSNTGTPLFFAPLNNTTYLVGPSPDSSYAVEVVGTQRPTPLSSGNSSTFLTQSLPDVFIAASMIFGAGYMRDFGMQTDTPPMSQSWEGQYTKLMQSANVEELRKRFMSEGWQPMTPSAVATPKRV